MSEEKEVADTYAKNGANFDGGTVAEEVANILRDERKLFAWVIWTAAAFHALYSWKETRAAVGQRRNLEWHCFM